MRYKITKKLTVLYSLYFSLIGLEATTLSNRVVKVYRNAQLSVKKESLYKVKGDINTIGDLKKEIKNYHSQQDYDGNNYEVERQIIRNLSSEDKKELEDNEAIPSEGVELVLKKRFFVFLSPDSKKRVEVYCLEDRTLSELKEKICKNTGVSTKNKRLKLTFNESIVKKTFKLNGGIRRLKVIQEEGEYIYGKRADDVKLIDLGTFKENRLITLMDNKKSFSKYLSIFKAMF